MKETNKKINYTSQTISKNPLKSFLKCSNDNSNYHKTEKELINNQKRSNDYSFNLKKNCSI